MKLLNHVCVAMKSKYCSCKMFDEAPKLEKIALDKFGADVVREADNTLLAGITGHNKLNNYALLQRPF